MMSHIKKGIQLLLKCQLFRPVELRLIIFQKGLAIPQITSPSWPLDVVPFPGGNPGPFPEGQRLPHNNMCGFIYSLIQVLMMIKKH